MIRRKIRVRISKEELIERIDEVCEDSIVLFGSGHPGLADVGRDRVRRTQAILKQMVKGNIPYLGSFLIVVDQELKCDKKKCPGVLSETGEIRDHEHGRLHQPYECEVKCNRCFYVGWV